VLYFLSAMLSASGGPAGLFLLVAFAGTIVVVVRWLGRQAEIKALTAQVNRHLRVLATKHATLESRNGYGAVHPREWGKEVDRFLASTGVVFKRLSPADAHKLITRAVEQDRRTGLAARLQSAWEGGALRDPLQFEAACAARLPGLATEVSTVVAGVAAQLKIAGDLSTGIKKLNSELAGALPAINANIDKLTVEFSRKVTDSAEAVSKTTERLTTTTDAVQSQMEQSFQQFDRQMQQQLTRTLEVMGNRLASISEKLVDDYTRLANSLGARGWGCKKGAGHLAP